MEPDGDEIQSIWCSKEDHDQMFEELQYLNKYDTQINHWRDLLPLYFKNQVLNKYKNHEYCRFGDESILSSISFLSSDKKTVETSVEFVFRYKGIIMVDAREFVGVPPKERKHWRKFEVRLEKDH